MVHTASPNRVAGWTAESLVGELIGLAGIDLALVSPFANLAESSTDRLQLESITGDVAVLDWQSPAQTIESLRDIGFDGGRAPHQHDSEIPAQPADHRRIYALDLTLFSSAGDVLSALEQLRADRQVRTFTLGQMQLPVAPKSQPELNRNPAVAAPPIAQRADREEQPEPQSVPMQDRESLDLDQLLDQLDQLDP
jgi:hypothetical protein